MSFSSFGVCFLFTNKGAKRKEAIQHLCRTINQVALQDSVLNLVLWLFYTFIYYLKKDVLQFQNHQMMSILEDGGQHCLTNLGEI